MRQARRVIVGLVAAGVCHARRAAVADPSWSGVYTAEQAAAGEKIYFEKCASCHGADLAGIERAPALTGGAFVESWHGKDLRRLLDRLDTMPPAAPKSLSPAESVAVLAFLLRAADMPAGPTALPTDRAQLARITFERSRAAAGAGAARRGPRGAAPLRPRRARGAGHQRATVGTWTTYGGNLASHRYSPADQITKDNFNQLRDRVAAEDRLPRPAARHALFRHAAAGRPRAVHDRRHAARGHRARRRHRRDAVDAHARTKAVAARTRFATAPAAASRTGPARTAPTAASSTSRPATG